MSQAQTFLPVSQLGLGFILMEDNFKLPKRVFHPFCLVSCCFTLQTLSKKCLFLFCFFFWCFFFCFVLVQHLVWCELQSHLEHLVPTVVQAVKCICTYPSFSANRVWLDQQGPQVREACQEMWYVCTNVLVFPTVPWFHLTGLVFPSTGFIIRFKRLCFIVLFSWLNWDIWRHWEWCIHEIFSYSLVARGRHGDALFLNKLPKVAFAARSLREKCQGLLSLRFCFVASLSFVFPFGNTTSWYKNHLGNTPFYYGSV